MDSMNYLVFGALFSTVFAMSIGLFEFGGEDSEEDEDFGPDFHPQDYTSTATGSSGGDMLQTSTFEADLAYLLQEDDDILSGTGTDFVKGSSGNDMLVLRPEDAVTSGDDTVQGGADYDTLFGQGGDDTMNGAEGNDNLFGGAGDDILEGGDGDDNLFGGSGDDILAGGALDDPDAMDDGADILDGGAGDDVLILGEGDVGTGGEGYDTFEVYEIESPGSPAANVTDFEAATDAIHVHYYETTDPETGEVIEPTIDVGYDEDADMTSVMLNGFEVATLDGDAGISASDVVLTPVM